MKSFYGTLLFSLSLLSVKAQPTYVDSLKQKLMVAGEDTTKALLLSELAFYYIGIKPDSGVFYSRETLRLSQKNDFIKGEALGYAYMSFALHNAGNYKRALETALSGLKMAEQLKNNREEILSLIYFQLGLLKREIGDNSGAKAYIDKSIQSAEEMKGYVFLPYTQLGSLYVTTNQLYSALYYTQKAYRAAAQSKYKRITAWPIRVLAATHLPQFNIHP